MFQDKSFYNRCGTYQLNLILKIRKLGFRFLLEEVHDLQDKYL